MHCRLWQVVLNSTLVFSLSVSLSPTAPTAGVDQHDGLPVCFGRGMSPAAQHPWPGHLQPAHGPHSRAQTLHDLHGPLRCVQPPGLSLLLLLIGFQQDARQPLRGPAAVPTRVRSRQGWPPRPDQCEGPAGSGAQSRPLPHALQQAEEQHWKVLRYSGTGRWYCGSPPGNKKNLSAYGLLVFPEIYWFFCF